MVTLLRLSKKLQVKNNFG